MKKLEAEDLSAAELETLRAALKHKSGATRLNPNVEKVQHAFAKLVLSLIEFLRRLMERQAIRRMEAGTLTPEETEALGQALMRLEQTIHELARHFGIDPDDLNLDLGPLGRLT